MVNTYKKSALDSKLRASYKKRKNCIKKKASELATLCGVNVCVVCIGSEGDIESWPENQSEVRSVIDMYKDCLKNGKNKKKRVRFDEGSNKHVFGDLLGAVDAKLKKINERIDFVNFMNEVQKDLKDHQVVPYCCENTTNNGYLKFEMDSDMYDQDMIWDELEGLEDKTTSFGFSTDFSTIVSDDSCCGSTPSKFADCYTHDQVVIDTDFDEIIKQIL